MLRLLWVWMICVAAGAAQAEELRFALGQTWGMPFADLREGELKGGILFDLMQRVATHAGAEARFVVLPSKRVKWALQTGAVDLHCLLSPSWFPAAAERWSVPVLRLDDVLLTGPGGPAEAPDIARAQGLSIGVVRGYTYPTLESGFEQGRLQREEASTQEQMLRKLVRGRSQFGVASHFAAEWFNRQQPPEQRVRILQAVDSVQAHCLVGEKPRLAPDRILAAVRRVVDSGEVKTILTHYR